MSIVGFQINKLSAERTKPASGQVTVNNNVAVTGIDEHSASKEDKKVLRFSFDCTIAYGPDIGKVMLSGALLFTCTKENYDVAIKQWQSEKKLDKKVGKIVIEAILNRCNVLCTVLGREVDLPAPFPTRKVSAK